jgi:DNA-binding NarL/FixJ family response regulator
MVAIAILSADPLLRRRMQELLRGEPDIRIVGVAKHPTELLPLIEQNQLGAILADTQLQLHERFDGSSPGEHLNDGRGNAPLTARELDVLAAMADGASNKAIARRLGISFHTAKFHVAAILAKLDADSRTEAVTKAAQLGLVML